MSFQYPSRDATTTMTINSGNTLSDAIDLDGMRPVLLGIPSDFTGTTISFEVATTLAGTYGSIRDKTNNIVSYTVTAGDFVKIEPIDALGLRFIKLAAGSAQASNQDIELIVTPL